MQATHGLKQGAREEETETGGEQAALPRPRTEGERWVDHDRVPQDTHSILPARETV